MPCVVCRAYCAPGGPEQNQRRQRLAHPERPLCPISVQRQADWEIAFSAAQHSDAAGTRPARPRTAVYADGAKNTRSVLSKKDRTALRFWVSQPVAAAARTRPFSLLSTRNDRTASISAAAGFIPRWTYIILYCSGLCGKDAPGGLAAGGGPPAVSIVWGPRRPTGRRVDCVGTPLPLRCSKKITSRRGS